MSNPIKVMVVDDSAFMRRAIVGMLNTDPAIQVVGEAFNGEDALKKIKTLQPDIITMDIEMPIMTGLEALRVIMKENPIPVIMVSSLTEEGAKETIKALEYGAVDYIPKHITGNIAGIINIKEELVKKIKMLGMKKLKITLPSGTDKIYSTIERSSSQSRSRINVVVIGASTGGPKSLQEVIPRLPKDLPCGVLLIQHMLPLFTAPFAERMNELSQVEVREAKDGDAVKPGLVLIAPGGSHMTVKKMRGGDAYVKLSKEPPMLHMPSVDIGMSSVAEAFTEHTLGVILTGMGQDGKEGMMAIRKAKGRTIAQDEETSVIFGMPKAAIESGCVDKIVPLGNMAEEIVNAL
ncbi:MAG: chemotaxis response regulator protein-glutamate methylesterase [Nitrospira sp.]|nr:chemotaxis response regulator protein-glutamate methylesterase [Nitrospira sp.]